jgi:hypothetical protein
MHRTINKRRSEIKMARNSESKGVYPWRFSDSYLIISVLDWENWNVKRLVASALAPIGEIVCSVAKQHCS